MKPVAGCAYNRFPGDGEKAVLNAIARIFRWGKKGTCFCLCQAVTKSQPAGHKENDYNGAAVSLCCSHLFKKFLQKFFKISSLQIAIYYTTITGA
jgi:hypothetical protein